MMLIGHGAGLIQIKPAANSFSPALSIQTARLWSWSTMKGALRA